ncbi:hypothetical protein V8F20_006961 [Naviculisporaceae sp. PSN 640]
MRAVRHRTCGVTSRYVILLSGLLRSVAVGWRNKLWIEKVDLSSNILLHRFDSQHLRDGGKPRSIPVLSTQRQRQRHSSQRQVTGFPAALQGPNEPHSALTSIFPSGCHTTWDHFACCNTRAFSSLHFIFSSVVASLPRDLSCSYSAFLFPLAIIK